MADWTARHDELAALGLRLVALSVDEPRRTEALRQTERWPFPVLCDVERSVVRLLDLYNPAEKGGIAVPATLVLDADRVVQLASIDKVRFRLDADTLLAHLRGEGEAPDGKKVMRPGARGYLRVVANVARFGLRSPWRPNE